MDFNSLIRFVDFTSLNENDTPESIAEFCKNPAVQHGQVAAVCVYPQFVKQVARSIPPSIKIATVANFPNGDSALAEVLAEIKQSLTDGAHEIDVVFPYKFYLQGKRKEAIDFIAACKTACGPYVLKVILETGAFPEANLIQFAASDVIAAGADFVKTSTGKITPGATLEAAQAILMAIKSSSKPVGLKVAGGVRTLEQAEAYLKLAQEMLGQNWPTPQTFRIGSSQIGA